MYWNKNAANEQQTAVYQVHNSILGTWAGYFDFWLLFWAERGD